MQKESETACRGAIRGKPWPVTAATLRGDPAHRASRPRFAIFARLSARESTLKQQLLTTRAISSISHPKRLLHALVVLLLFNYQPIAGIDCECRDLSHFQNQSHQTVHCLDCPACSRGTGSVLHSTVRLAGAPAANDAFRLSSSAGSVVLCCHSVSEDREMALASSARVSVSVDAARPISVAAALANAASPSATFSKIPQSGPLYLRSSTLRI